MESSLEIVSPVQSINSSTARTETNTESVTLTSLPFELLTIILELAVCDDTKSKQVYLAACRTSSLLNAVATPLLYREFSATSAVSKKTTQFLIEITKNPILARHVRRLELHPWRNQSVAPLSLTKFDSLVSSVAAMSGSDQLYKHISGEIEAGSFRAKVTIFCLIAHRLEHLGIYFADEKRWVQGRKGKPRADQYDPEVICALIAQQHRLGNERFLARLRSFQMRIGVCNIPNHQQSTWRGINSILSVPSIQDFSVSLSDYMRPEFMPKALQPQSNINKLTIEGGCLSTTVLCSLIDCCQNLEEFRTTWYHIPKLYRSNPNQAPPINLDIVVQSLLRHKQTLRILQIHARAGNYGGRDLIPMKSLCEFTKLESLAMDDWLVADDGKCLHWAHGNFIASQFYPPNLKSLDLRSMSRREAILEIIVRVALESPSSLKSLTITSSWNWGQDQSLPHVLLSRTEYFTLHHKKRMYRTMVATERLSELAPCLRERADLVNNDQIAMLRWNSYKSSVRQSTKELIAGSEVDHAFASLVKNIERLDRYGYSDDCESSLSSSD